MTFWKLTPFQLNLLCDAHQKKINDEHHNKLWHTWHGAAFARMKEMPSFEEITAAPREKNIDEAAIKARLKAYKKRLENGDRN